MVLLSWEPSLPIDKIDSDLVSFTIWHFSTIAFWRNCNTPCYLNLWSSQIASDSPGALCVCEVQGVLHTIERCMRNNQAMKTTQNLVSSNLISVLSDSFQVRIYLHMHLQHYASILNYYNTTDISFRIRANVRILLRQTISHFEETVFLLLIL